MLISVLMPCFNAEEHIASALESLRQQTYSDFEVILIDDGSTDGTVPIMHQYAATDPRFRVYLNETNQGLIYTLNRGISLANGTYIARMDADDESLPNRFAELVAFAATKPDLAVVSSEMIRFDREGREYLDSYTESSQRSLLFLSLFKTPLNHPASFFRADVIKKMRYRSDDRCLHVEDYDLWTRMLEAGHKVYKLKKPLYRYRLNEKSVSNKYTHIQRENFYRLSRDHIEKVVGLNLSEESGRVVCNKFDKVGVRELSRGLSDYLVVKREFLKQFICDDDDRIFIYRAYIQNLIDILIQAFKRGTSGARFYALLRISSVLRHFVFDRENFRYLKAKFQ